MELQTLLKREGTAHSIINNQAKQLSFRSRVVARPLFLEEKYTVCVWVPVKTSVDLNGGSVRRKEKLYTNLNVPCIS
jgi:hypothetical protein